MGLPSYVDVEKLGPLHHTDQVRPKNKGESLLSSTLREDACCDSLGLPAHTIRVKPRHKDESLSSSTLREDACCDSRW